MQEVRYRRAEVLIDLGEDRSVPDTTPTLPRDWHRVFLVIGLLLALTLGGAAHPGPALTPVAALPGAGIGTFLVTVDSLFALEAAPGSQARISGYRIGTDERRWSTTLPWMDGYSLLASTRAGILLAVSPTMTDSTTRQNGTITALDPATGRKLWYQWNADLVAVREDLGTALLAHDEQGTLSELYAVDLHTGVPRWQVPLDTTGDWTLMTTSPPVAGAPARVVVLVGDTLTVRDQQTGRPLGTQDAGIPSSVDRQDLSSPRLYVIGQRVIVAYEDRFRTVLASFTLATLEPRWRSTMPTETDFLAACGPVLCAGTGVLDSCWPVLCSAIHSVLYGLDPNSAAVRWSSTTWSWSGPVFINGPINGGPGRDGQLLVYNREPLGSVQAADALVDAGTGRVLLALGSWRPVPAGPDTSTVVVAAAGAGESWFAVLSTGPSPALRPLGRLPVSGPACQSTEHFVVCPTLDRQLVTWRYRSR